MQHKTAQCCGRLGLGVAAKTLSPLSLGSNKVSQLVSIR